MDGVLDSNEAARRLGIKVATLYVYVSRGLIESHRDPTGRRSFFTVADIERLERRTRERRSSETRPTTISTSVSQITDDGPLYRGIAATELLERPFESVADVLWGSEPGAWRAQEFVVPTGLATRDTVRVVVSMAGSFDPLRSDRRPESVVRTARTVITTIVRNLPATATFTDGSVAGGLAAWLGQQEPSPAVVRATNALLVLLADHEMATSTVAVRLAASTRSDLYDALLAGLGVLGGPLHGANSELAGRLLATSLASSPAAAIDEAMRWNGLLPGFGHAVYRSGDPRFAAMMPMLATVMRDDDRAALDELVAIAAKNHLPQPNIDMAVAALVRATGAAPEAGPTIFSVARIAGWTAHYLEELSELPLRFRSRAVYVTPVVTSGSA